MFLYLNHFWPSFCIERPLSIIQKALSKLLSSFSVFNSVNPKRYLELDLTRLCQFIIHAGTEEFPGMSDGARDKIDCVGRLPPEDVWRDGQAPGVGTSHVPPSFIIWRTRKFNFLV